MFGCISGDLLDMDTYETAKKQVYIRKAQYQAKKTKKPNTKRIKNENTNSTAPMCHED
jgi:hypothetical protein